VHFSQFSLLNTQLDSILTASSSEVTGESIRLVNVKQSEGAKKSQALFDISVSSVMTLISLEIDNVNENLLRADQSEVTLSDSQLVNLYSDKKDTAYLKVEFGTLVFDHVQFRSV